jgi:hypothetical protein
MHPQVADEGDSRWIWKVTDCIAQPVTYIQKGFLGPSAWELAVEQITLHKEIVNKQRRESVML